MSYADQPQRQSSDGRRRSGDSASPLAWLCLGYRPGFQRYQEGRFGPEDLRREGGCAAPPPPPPPKDIPPPPVVAPPPIVQTTQAPPPIQVVPPPPVAPPVIHEVLPPPKPSEAKAARTKGDPSFGITDEDYPPPRNVTARKARPRSPTTSAPMGGWQLSVTGSSGSSTLDRRPARCHAPRAF